MIDPKKAALDVADYQSAISWASQTALRDVIGKTMLSDMLEGRDKISSLLQKIIDERTSRGASTSFPSKSKTSSFLPAWKMRCRCRRRRNANARPA